MNGPADDILRLLKTQGPTQTLAVAAHLGVSRQAARQHLERLADDGLIEYATERAGVGRPKRAWSVSAQGHARFPNAHAQVSVELIEAVRAEFGAEGLDRLVARRERATTTAYGWALDGADGLEDRVARLAAARRIEGYMAEWRALDDGGYLLVENHCPICAAAAACQGFCRSELVMFQALLAPAKVERTDHILAGARRCAYRVTLV